MAFDQHSNFAYSAVTIAPSPATSGLTLTVASGQGALFPVAPFNATVWPGGLPLPLASNAEIVRVLTKSGDSFTSLVRAQEGSSPIAISVGYQIMASVTTRTLTDIENTQQSGVGNYLGAYAGGTVYARGDSVSLGGVQYLSVQNSNAGHNPSTDSGFVWWSPLVPPGPLLQPGDLVPSAAVMRTGCLPCDGQSYLSSAWPALFNAIGYAYGGGSGTFQVPDLRGRSPVGPDSMNPAGSTRGAAARLSARTISAVVNGNTVGASGGRQDETLTLGELPPHLHGIVLSVSGSIGANPTGITVNNAFGDQNGAKQYAGGSFYQGKTAITSSDTPQTSASFPFASGGYTSLSMSHFHGLTDPQHSHSFSGGVSGDSGDGSSHGLNGDAHNLMDPYQVCNWFIYHG